MSEDTVCPPMHYGDRAGQVPATGEHDVKCNAPILIDIDGADDGNYTVDWTDVAGATSYVLQEDDDPLFPTPTTAYSGTATALSVVGKAKGVYYYRVMAVCPGTDSPWSNIESAVVLP